MRYANYVLVLEDNYEWCTMLAWCQKLKRFEILLIRSLKEICKKKKKKSKNDKSTNQIGDIKQALVPALVGEMTCLKSKDEIK